METVVETEIYLRDAKAAGLSDDERSRIVDFAAAHPDAGREIPGTAGARKVRFTGKGMEGRNDHAEEETDRRTTDDRERQAGPGLR